MAVKRDFGSEKQANKLSEQTGQKNPKTGKPENVDSLVSRFLTELNTLSSEMGQDTSAAADAPADGTGENRLPDLPRNAEPGSGVSLEKINREIEESLAQLETLRPTFALPKEEPPPQTAPPAKLVEPVQPKAKPDRVVPASPNPRVPPRRRPELFRNTIVAPKPAYRRPVTWILTAVLLLAALYAAYFYWVGLK